MAFFYGVFCVIYASHSECLSGSGNQTANTLLTTRRNNAEMFPLNCKRELKKTATIGLEWTRESIVICLKINALEVKNRRQKTIQLTMRTMKRLWVLFVDPCTPILNINILFFPSFHYYSQTIYCTFHRYISAPHINQVENKPHGNLNNEKNA